MAEPLNTGLSAQQVLTAFNRALNDYTDTEIDTLLSAKQDALTFDSAPTEDSTNPVTSGGVKTALAAKQDSIADLTAIRSGAEKGETAVQPAEFEADQQRQETEIGAVAALGAKNLLNVTAQSMGIVVVNADGTLTVNGSSASNTSVTLSSLWLKKGTYKLSSGVLLPTGTYISIRIAAGGEIIQVRDAVTEVEFDVPVDMTINRVWLFINANTQVDNLTIYPMIRRAEITDSTYVPYAPTNRELYEMILALQSGS